MAGFKDLEIYKIAFDLSIEVHELTLRLPKFELYEQGNQIRRSSKRIKDTIAEGYGRRRYKAEYIRFLIYAQSSTDETLAHLDSISVLYRDISDCKNLKSQYINLGRKINYYIQYVECNWKS